MGTAKKRPPEEIARLLGWLHCASDPLFATCDRRRFAASLGWLPSEFGDGNSVQRAAWKVQGKDVSVCELLDSAQEIQKRGKELAKELKESVKAGKRLAQQADDLQALRRSWTWRFLAKPFYSIEKRLRRLAARKRDAAGQDGMSSSIPPD